MNDTNFPLLVPPRTPPTCTSIKISAHPTRQNVARATAHTHWCRFAADSSPPPLVEATTRSSPSTLADSGGVVVMPALGATNHAMLDRAAGNQQASSKSLGRGQRDRACCRSDPARPPTCSAGCSDSNTLYTVYCNRAQPTAHVAPSRASEVKPTGTPAFGSAPPGRLRSGLPPSLAARRALLHGRLLA